MNIKEYLEKIDKVIENGKYKDNWASLANHPVPEWYQKGKLGIFVHWGIYSVPAYKNEWYPRLMYKKEHHVYEHHLKTYGHPSEFGYKDFIPMFKGENFDADEWLDLFEEAGAKYVVPVGEHHDGFAMYDSQLNRWNASKMGPCRDIIGEIECAARDREITFCVSSHRAEHFFFFNGGRDIENSDVNDEKYRDLYGPAVLVDDYKKPYTPEWHNIYSYPPTKEWLEDWLANTCEMIDKCRPGLVYFDWWIHNSAFKPYLKKFVAYYYNRAEEWGKEVTINYKYNAMPETIGVYDIERGQMSDIGKRVWQTDTSTAKDSWGYIENNDFKTAREIICAFVDVVSKNGNFLINVGPKSDGTITKEETDILKTIGKWMKINGEGIYESTFWKTFGEGPTLIEDGDFSDTNREEFTEKDIRYTAKDGNVYAFVLKCPENGKVVLKEMKKAENNRNDYIVKNVTLLGGEKEVSFDRTTESLNVDIGDFKSEYPICLKVEID